MVPFLALFLAHAPLAKADLITGDIDFSGTAQLDSMNVNMATSVQSWNANNVISGTGTFTNLPNGTSINFPSSIWTFNSGPASNFWSAGGFRLDLKASSIEIDGKGYLNILFTGTVHGNGYKDTACIGTFSAVNTGGNGYKFSETMTFSMLPPPPRLRIVPNGLGGLKILWPASDLDPAYNYDYTLQANSNFTSTNWVTPVYAITNAFGTNFCTVPPAAGSMYFRLSQ
jgi:hypothetical protein